MTQLGLFDPRTRWEIPVAEYSWVEAGAVIRRRVGAHSIDFAWPWWKPGFSW